MILYEKLRHVSDDVLSKYEKAIEYLLQKETNVIHFSHDDYPPRLRSVEKPPLVIFHKGKLRKFDQGQYVAVVGTRRGSHRAHQFARELAKELAGRGYVIVSGLARGIDTEAHCGALDVHGKTVAVLPSPVDIIYPVENQELSIDISASGALISEISSFAYSKLHLAKYVFVNRNRLTSALSDAVVIVESGKDGGSMHQFIFAKQQGRKVFVPQPPDPQRSAYTGYEILMKGGAVQLHSAQDIIDFLERKDNEERAQRTGLDRYVR